MKLEDCTKAELIEIIKSSMIFEYEVENALRNIEWERKQKKNKIADKVDKEVAKHLNAYFDFLKKYDGFKITDIPPDELKAARVHLDKSEKLSKKRDKIYKEIYVL